ncbi:hypothetical protein MRX96_054319 [Rhipicephalus microplus]
MNYTRVGSRFPDQCMGYRAPDGSPRSHWPAGPVRSHYAGAAHRGGPRRDPCARFGSRGAADDPPPSDPAGSRKGGNSPLATARSIGLFPLESFAYYVGE